MIKLILKSVCGKLYRSASSKTKTSNSLTLTFLFPLPSRNSSILPGVPTMMSAPVDRNLSMSCVGDDVSEETKSNGGG
jgi:hypothetical protein